MSDDKTAQKENRAKYQADLMIYSLTLLERLATGTKYEANAKEALRLVREIK